MKKITNHTKQTLRDGMLRDFRGIFTISGFLKKPLKPWIFKIAIIVAALFLFFVFLLEAPLYSLIKEFVNLLITVLPGILGFTIGGYSFLIGFVQPELMEKISEPRKNSVFSLFQVASSAFACNILLQAIGLCIGYIYYFIMWIDTNKKVVFNFPLWYTTCVNVLGLILITVTFVISIVIILQLVVNVFNFSQLHHYNVNKLKVDKAEAQELADAASNPTPEI